MLEWLTQGQAMKSEIFFFTLQKRGYYDKLQWYAEYIASFRSIVGI